MGNRTVPKHIAQFVSWEAFQIWVLPLFSVPVTVVIGWLSDLLVVSYLAWSRLHVRDGHYRFAAFR